MINSSFLSPPPATRQSIYGIAPLLSKTSYRSRAPRSIPSVSMLWVPPSYDGAFHFSTHGPLAPNMTECLRLYHFSPVRPAASKFSSFSHSGAPRGYIDLLRNLHGPRLVRFDRGPRRFAPAAMATGSGCFRLLFWILQGFVSSRFSHGSMTIVYGSDLD